MKKIAVIGSGTMGNGIAHLLAQHEFKVSLIDVNEEALNKGLATINRNLERMVAKGTISEDIRKNTLLNISSYSNIKDGINGADLVIEAATEKENIKYELFRELDGICPKEVILATNTSSISITKIAGVTGRPSRVIGMHFMNPVPVMKLVEIIRGYITSDEVTNTIMKLAKALGKTPVEVNDYPGFIANRVLMPMLNEAFYALFEGVAGVNEIDTVMKLGMAHPMGPLQLADFIGLDVCLSILEVMHRGFGNSKYAPCPLLVNMVAAGNLGVKTGIGFYTYRQDNKELVVAPQFS